MPPQWIGGRVLDVPDLSQRNPSGAGSDWCGKTAASMVHNYYVIAGGGDATGFIRHRSSPANLVYPNGRVAGETSSGSATVNEPLLRIKRGWTRRTLVSADVRRRILAGASSDEVAETVFAPVVASIRANNPVVSYTGMSTRVSGPIHIVVVSGYAHGADGRLWLHIDDPATMSNKVPLLGASNLIVELRGNWGPRDAISAQYWLRAGRLLELNQHTRGVSTDLWGDYAGSAGPGVASWITSEPTPDGSYAHDLGAGGVTASPTTAAPRPASLPLDLGGGLALTSEAVEAAFAHVETGSNGGWYPVSDNTLWHGGVHLVPAGSEAPRTVHACLPGRVVAARLGAGEAAEGPFGSRNFVLVRHEMPASPAATPAAAPAAPTAATPPDTAPPVPVPGRLPGLPPLAGPPRPPTLPGAPGTASGGAPAPAPRIFFSLYMHLAPLVESAGAVPWLQTASPETFEVTVDRLNCRSDPNTDASTRILGVATRGAVFTALPDASEAARDAPPFRWGRVQTLAGARSGYMSTGSAYMRSTRTTEPDRPLLDALRGGAVVALDRAVAAGDVLWEAGEHGLRQHPGAVPPGEDAAASLTTLLHWEVFSVENLLSDLCRAPAAPVSGDGQAGPPPALPPLPGTPVPGGGVRVSSASGPATAEVGQPVTFRVTSFSRQATPEVRARISWELRLDGAALTRAERVGEAFTTTPLAAHAGKTLSAHPFLNAPADGVAARTRVAAPPPWWTAEDPDADFQVDAAAVLSLFDVLENTVLERDLLAERATVVVEARATDGPPRARAALEPAASRTEAAGILAFDELAGFYASDPGGRAGRLRHVVCRFATEWGIPDVRAAVDALGVSAPAETAAAVERHQWWAEARAAGVELPAGPQLWHYHPLSFLVQVAGTSEVPSMPDDASSQAPDARTVVWGLRVSPEFKSRVLRMATTLQINADYLMSIMAFESAGTFSASVWNRAGSQAVGLIQFMSDAASDLHTSLDVLASMTSLQQLDFVERYFQMRQRQFGKITTLSDVYMAVLRPANVGDPESTVLFRRGTTAYRQNAGLDTNRDGTVTKAECAAVLQRKLQEGEPLRG